MDSIGVKNKLNIYINRQLKNGLQMCEKWVTKFKQNRPIVKSKDRLDQPKSDHSNWSRSVWSSLVWCFGPVQSQILNDRFHRSDLV